MSYFDNVNPDLLAQVDAKAQRICEFGCGGGALARAIRKENPQVYLVGIEKEAEALQRAHDVLDHALACDLNDSALWEHGQLLDAALPQASFDHLIFGDVLEHLNAPDELVNQAAQRLVPGGSILACIPNVQHWSVFTQLVAGSWPRLDSGLFDRTHVRWFTLQDMVSMFEGAGLVVENVVPRIFDMEQGIAVMEYLEPLAIYLGVDVQQFTQRGLPLQYVLTARRPH